MATSIEKQAQALDDYEKALERWLGDVSKEDVAKVLEKLGQWDKLPYSRLLKLYLDLCSKCGACAEECHLYRAYPRKELNPTYRANLLRSVYQRHFTLPGKIFRRLTGAKELDEKMLKEWFVRFYQCNMCRRCNVFCPFGVDNMAITRTARVLISSALGKTTESMAKGARSHLETGNTAGMKEAAFRNIVGFWEEEIKEKKGWEVKVPVDKVGAEMYLLPTNTDYFLSLETMEGIAATLYAAKADWTISSKVFDSVNYGTFFDDDIWVKIVNMHIEEAKRLKCKTLVIGECGHATKVLMFLAPSLLGAFPFEVKNILQVTWDYIEQGKIKLNKEANPEPVTYHDPCNITRMCGIMEEPRKILKAACKDFREMVPNRDENYCCGGGGGVALETASHDYRVEVAGKIKVDQIKETGAKVVATACANCKVQLAHLIDYYQLDVKWAGVHDLVLNALVL
jgi:Fe-S oxidoreductase